jgi:hypothetical protein
LIEKAQCRAEVEERIAEIIAASLKIVAAQY